MLTPGPDHPINIIAAPNRWRAFFNGHVIADSDDALELKEASYKPVIYFPRKDVGMDYMTRTDKVTHCPYKGDAAHYSLHMDGQFADNAAWSYESPYPAMDLISDRIAFYPDAVEVYAVDDAKVNPHHHQAHTDSGEVDEIVQHTDAGDGRAQREHWTPNVDTPDIEDGVR